MIKKKKNKINVPTWIWIDSSGVKSIGFPSTGDWSKKIKSSLQATQQYEL